MRSLFAVLLLANLALFGLDRGWFGQPLAERGREPDRARNEVRADSIQVPALAEAAPSVNAAPAVSAPPAAAPETAPAPVAAPVATPAAAPAPEAAPVAQPPAPAAPETPGSAVVATGAVCAEWGNFSDANLALARKWAGERFPKARQDTRHEPGKNGWMVIVPPQANAGAAQAAAAALNKNGVKDYFVILEAGPLQHAISLGVFSTEAGARKQAAQLKTQGVGNTQVVSRAAQTGGHWLRLDGLTQAERDALDGVRTRFGRQALRPCR